MRARWIPALAVLGLFLSGPVNAQLVSEIRVGGLYHDAGIFGTRKESGADINGELLFGSPRFLAPIFKPRPHIGFSVNTAGDTNQLYFGLTWEWMFTDNLFGGFSLGGAANDGKLDKSDPDRKDLGSHVLFRESLSLGWRFNEHHSLSIMLDHVSNAGLARYNGGLDGIGLRYGYRF